MLICVYQKAYVHYVDHNNTNPNTLSTIAPLPTVKKATTETEVLDKPISKENTPMVAASKHNDIEEIDSLIQALKEREDAFKNRVEFELHIEQLIKQALDNRSAAIAYMNKEELRLLELQKELLKTRDTAYDKIGQPNIPISGE